MIVNCMIPVNICAQEFVRYFSKTLGTKRDNLITFNGGIRRNGHALSNDCFFLKEDTIPVYDQRQYI